MAENLFLIIAALVIASAFWVVFSPNLIHSAVSLLFTLFGTAGVPCRWSVALPPAGAPQYQSARC